MMQYQVDDWQTWGIGDGGERKLLANFVAEIIRETRYESGAETSTSLTVSGIMKPDKEGGKPVYLPDTTMTAPVFASMSWVMQSWGVRAVIPAGGSIKDELRVAMQLMSKPEVVTIYKHLGWTTIAGKLMFLHASGAIGEKGHSNKVSVELPPDLIRYDLSPTDTNPRTAFNATLALAKLGPPELTWPLIAATFAPLFQPVDFAIHVAGRTGTFKSELLSLFQSHYGSAMDARHLPGSWSSTANALEAQAFFAKNCPFVIDDFVPGGTSWQVKAYQTIADKIIRAQGNQAGRARLTDVSSLQAAMYPRGIVLSSGEDIPLGHSVRARMLILEISPGDIDTAVLSKAQQSRGDYTTTTASLIQWLATNPRDVKPRAIAIRDTLLEIGHTRTPAMVGTLIATIEEVIKWAEVSRFLTRPGADELIKIATAAIIAAGKKQQSYLEEADPVDVITSAIRQVFAAGMGHARSLSGAVPRQPELLGWTDDSQSAEVPRFLSHGPTIGWVDWDRNEFFLDLALGYPTVRKVMGQEVSLTKATLFKRMKDAGLLTRTDDTRMRNSVRVTAEQHPRNVLAMALDQTIKSDDDHE